MISVLLVDHHDSFTYNVVELLRRLEVLVTVSAHDELHMVEMASFSHIILSPGPGLPSDYPHTLDVINRYVGKKSIMGICLGMQAIAIAHGAALRRIQPVMHGIGSSLRIHHAHQADALFTDIPQPMTVGRYHSWYVDDSTLPDTLIPLAHDDDGHLMVMRHRSAPLYGIQFHPESILTPHGSKLIHNWLSID